MFENLSLYREKTQYKFKFKIKTDVMEFINYDILEDHNAVGGKKTETIISKIECENSIFTKKLFRKNRYYSINIDTICTDVVEYRLALLDLYSRELDLPVNCMKLLEYFWMPENQKGVNSRQIVGSFKDFDVLYDYTGIKSYLSMRKYFIILSKLGFLTKVKGIRNTYFVNTFFYTGGSKVVRTVRLNHNTYK